MEKERETLGSRMGFILLSAGCAIGLGNVWRFPYVAGKYGGGAFVLIYLLFLLLLGAPIMVMEFSIGRASRKNIASALRMLEPKGSRWHFFGPIAMLGNYVLMMFYTVVTGWLLSYCVNAALGRFHGLDAQATADHFQNMLASPGSMVLWMVAAIVISFAICSIGLRNGVERMTKVMMVSLLVIMLLLAIRSLILPNALAGLKFYLVPDFGRMMADGVTSVVFAAMGQAFFTLSLGIGSMAVFGSYIGKERSLSGETVNIVLLDTFVAIVSGLIIFPACSAFGVDPGSGPGLLFITLPNIFNQMSGGVLWCTLFFVFMSFAALSTLVAVFENIISYWMDTHGWSRRKAVAFNLAAISVLSIPCALGFNVWSRFQPLGAGTNVLDLEDFLVSNTILPLGALVIVCFCCWESGWGWKHFIAEADAGVGLKFPIWLRRYCVYVLPVAILAIFLYGYYSVFMAYK